MRVAVDARHLGRGRGIARYLDSMLSALASSHPEVEWVAVSASRPGFLPPPGIATGRPRLPPRLANASAALIGRPRVDRVAGGADVVWIPSPMPVAWSSPVPAVLTVHDLSWEQRPGDFTAYERAWHALARPRRLAARSSRIVCVSEETRTQMFAAGWPVEPGRTCVIPEAPEAGLASAPPGDQGRYLLYVGALEPRKGIDTLAAAIGVARGLGLELPVVVVGAGRESGLLAGLPGVELVGTTSDPELARLYRGATALVFPSKLEGFGLPPVEAAACGVPTVGSDLPVLREFLGEAYLATPPGDSLLLGEALFRISTDLALRNRLGEASREAVSGLSWERSAESLFAVLCEAAREAAS